MNTTSYATTDREPRTPPRSIVVRCLLGLVAILAAAALLAILGGALFLLPRWSSDQAAAKEVTQLVDQLRTAGQPMTAADLYRFHALSAGTPDATAAWLAAQKLCTGRLTQEEMALPYVGMGKQEDLRAGDGADQLAAAEQYLTSHAAALDAILAAAREPGQCRYAVKFEQAPMFTVDETQGVRSVTRLLALDVHVKAIRGQSEPALHSLKAMFTASESASHQLTIVEQLVRIGTLGPAMRQVELVLNELPLDDHQLVELSQTLAVTDIQGSFTRALIGERAVANEAFRQMPRGALLAQEQQQVLETITDTISLSSEPLPTARDRFQAEIALLDSRPARWSGRTVSLAASHFTSLQAAFNAYVKATAYRDGLLAAISAERHRLKTGHFPASLDDLVPDYLSSAPTDPFTGKSFQFRSSDEEIVISSFGANGKDDAALAADGSNTDDIVIRIQAMKSSLRPADSGF